MKPKPQTNMKHFITFLCCLLPLLSFSQLKPTEDKALLHIEVMDFSENLRPREVVLIRATGKNKTVKKITDAEGMAHILLPKGDTYKVTYRSFLEERSHAEIEIPNDPGEMEATLQIKFEMDADQTYELYIHFETDKSVIRSESFEELEILVEQLKLKPRLRIELAGHTDDQGSEDYNLTLSQNRAKAVKTYLTKKGIAASRIETTGYGESKPVASNGSPEGRARNRRTEIRIL